MAQRVVDHGSSRKYWTQIPNIIFTLGLTPYEFALYCLLKRTAGEDGVCWKSTATLARESGMSGGMVSKAKLKLQTVFAVIGKPLITIQEEANAKGGKPKHCIVLVDIWPQNFKQKGPSSQNEVDNSPNSPHERPSSYSEVASSPHERPSSPHEIKNNLREEEPSEEEQKPVSAHALLMDFHNNHLSGPLPDGKAQGAALKWLLGTYSKEVLIACYEHQLTEQWRAKVNWMTVKSDIGQWISRNGNHNGSNQTNIGTGNSGSQIKHKHKVC